MTKKKSDEPQVATQDVRDEPEKPVRKILVVPTAKLWRDDLPHFEGAQAVRDINWDSFLQTLETEGAWVEREAAEQDESYRQVIPYCVVLKRDAKNFASSPVFTYRRSGGVGEQRLAGKKSCGLGGHIDYGVDGSTPGLSAIEAALWRELHEEVGLGVDDVLEVVPVAFLNQESTPVGRVHLGVIYAVVVRPEAEVASREDELVESRWQKLASIQAEQQSQSENWEDWSVTAAGALPLAFV